MAILQNDLRHSGENEELRTGMIEIVVIRFLGSAETLAQIAMLR